MLDEDPKTGEQICRYCGAKVTAKTYKSEQVFINNRPIYTTSGKLTEAI